MAGYSGTPLVQKLGIKEGQSVALVHAPAGFLALLEPLPHDLTLLSQLRGKTRKDVLLFFTTKRAQLEKQVDHLKDHLAYAGGLWVCWPKKSAGVPTDVTEDVVREVALANGLVDNKVCAIDETWSGLRLVVRLENRAGWNL